MKLYPLEFRLLAVFSCLLTLHSPARAQTAERRTSIGVLANGLQYQGDFVSDYWQWDATRLAPGLAINQYLGRGLDLSTQAFYGELTGSAGPETRFSTTLLNLNLGFKLKLNNGWALKETARVQPYLLAASGLTYSNRTGRFQSTRIDLDKGYVDVFGAAGISLRLGGKASLFVQTGQHLPLNANLDGTPELSTPRWADRFLQHTLGLTFNLGQALDTDEDGVPDTRDKCPNTPQSATVDATGCPLDTDTDGVPDHQDSCPTEAGTADLGGCPDADTDGVSDPNDACPDTPTNAVVDASGCPEAPTASPADSSANTTARPDTAVVTAPAPTPAPDTDADGVPDTEDRCPNTAGPASNLGCPVVAEDARQRLQQATRSIRFEPNKAALLPSSYPTLDAILPILAAYPDYSLSLAGHTDSKGPAAFNLALSRERAAAARRYLLSQGVSESRIEPRGYGARHPIADNTTDAGRARNRRVEFDLFVSTGPNAAEVKYGPQPASLAIKPPAKPVKPTANNKAPLRKTTAKRRPTPKSSKPKAAAPKTRKR